VGLLIIFGVIILSGGLLVAASLLARPLVARVGRAYALLMLLPPLAALGAGLGLAGGIFLSIFLFGFDLGGKAPWWDRHLPAAGACAGSLIGSAVAILIIGRSGSIGRDLRDPAVDYDDGGSMLDPARDEARRG
jgi:hypothetical protein